MTDLSRLRRCVKGLRLQVGDVRGRKEKGPQVEHSASGRPGPPGPVKASLPMKLYEKDNKVGRISVSLS